jgi:putative membrane protein
MWHEGDGMGWWMLFGAFWMLVFWGGIIWLIVWGVGQAARGDRRHNDTPIEIARRRYAKGELTREEFEQLRRDLG